MLWIVVALIAMAMLAAVTIVAAVVAVRASRRTSEFCGEKHAHAPEIGCETPQDVDVRPAELQPRIVEGRVIVPPTQAQVVRTALGRPGVRANVLLFGLRHALQAENRDRITALIRREYRHRRRERLRAGRQAVRMAQPSSAPTTDRLHEQLREPKQISIAERMMM